MSVQRQLTNTLSAELAYVANHSSRAFIGNGPASNYNDPTIVGFGTLNTNQRRPFFNGGIQGYPLGNQGEAGTFGAPFGWTQGIDFFCNCGKTDYQSVQAKLNRRFAGGWSVMAHYTYQKAKNNTNSYFFIDPNLNYGPNEFGRDHNFVVTSLFELPFGNGKKYASDATGLMNALIGGWQVNTNVIVQSGIPFSVNYAGAGADRDTGPNRPNLIGDTDGPQTQEEWFNATPIGTAGSAFERPGRGTFGNLPVNSLTGPGYWRVDASLFKAFSIAKESRLEFRLEVVNLFNHVNLGNPDSEVGTATDARPNAGRINSTAYFGRDPQRNLQFAVRFLF